MSLNGQYCKDIFMASDSTVFKPKLTDGFLGRGCYAYVHTNAIFDYFINKSDKKSLYIYRYEMDEQFLSMFDESDAEWGHYRWITYLLNYIEIPEVPSEIIDKYYNKKYDVALQIEDYDIIYAYLSESYLEELQKYLMGKIYFPDTFEKPRIYLLRTEKALSRLICKDCVEISKKEIVKYKLAGHKVESLRDLEKLNREYNF